MGKVAEKQNSKRMNILDAAYELFTSKSFSTTTIDDVVRKAGIAKGTFYLYFKDKYDLMDRIIVHKSLYVMRDAFDKLNAEKLECKHEMSFSNQMTFIVNCIVNYFQVHKELITLVDKKLSKCINSSLIDSDLKDDIECLISENIKNGYTKEETIKKIYLVIDLIGSVCFDAIVYETPFRLDDIKPALFSAVERILV